MCGAMFPAVFSSTIVYGRAAERDGRRIHVLGYENMAGNRAAGPNAMLLPIPAAAPMGPDNAIDARMFASLLRCYRTALRSLVPQPHAAGRGRARSSGPGSVQVFDSGSYTIVLAREAALAAIEAALATVPEAKRPALNLALLDAYARWYPGWHLALCCFDGRIGEAEPMLWWYEPRDPLRVFLPGLDAHDGEVPRLDAPVAADHTIALGLDDASSPRLRSAVPEMMPDMLPARLSALFPRRVAGVADLKIELANGDWYLPVDPDDASLQAALRDRRPPPGA